MEPHVLVPVSKLEWDVFCRTVKDESGVELPTPLPDDGYAYGYRKFVPLTPMSTTEPSVIVCRNGIRIICT